MCCLPCWRWQKALSTKVNLSRHALVLYEPQQCITIAGHFAACGLIAPHLAGKDRVNASQPETSESDADSRLLPNMRLHVRASGQTLWRFARPFAMSSTICSLQGRLCGALRSLLR
jgi:hypothetical protein